MTTNNTYDLDLSRPTRELVIDVATRLLSRGEKPAVGNVRAIIGKGSNLTIQSALNDWWKDLGQRINALYRHPTLPDAVATAAIELWGAALKEADQSNEKYRVEADAQVVKAEERACDADVKLKQAEEGRQLALGELDSANATIVGLERTLAAESGHKASLEKQVVELRTEAASARNESESARREAAFEIDNIRNDASEQIERARKEFREQMDLAQSRFESVQKRMLVEIDKERQATITARQESQKEIEGFRSEFVLIEAKLRQRNSDLAAKVSDINTQAARLEGKLEEVSKQRDHLLAEAAVVSTKLRDRETRLRQAAEARLSRMKKNAPIFDENHDEIVDRREAGEKVSEIAAWLNKAGFDGGGAALNALLKQAGLL